MVTVKIECDGICCDVERDKAGLWYATSDELAGLRVATHSLDEMIIALPAGVSDLLDAIELKEKSGGK